MHAGVRNGRGVTVVIVATFNLTFVVTWRQRVITSPRGDIYRCVNEAVYLRSYVIYLLLRKMRHAEGMLVIAHVANASHNDLSS